MPFRPISGAIPTDFWYHSDIFLMPFRRIFERLLIPKLCHFLSMLDVILNQFRCHFLLHIALLIDSCGPRDPYQHAAQTVTEPLKPLCQFVCWSIVPTSLESMQVQVHGQTMSARPLALRYWPDNVCVLDIVRHQSRHNEVVTLRRCHRGNT